MTRATPALPLTLALAVGLATAACSTAPGVADAPDPANRPQRIEGTITAIDLEPWTYDGSAVVRVETADGGIVPVQLPARWNLCKAPPVDVGALAVGTQVLVVGDAANEGALVVCTDPAHRLVPLEAASSSTEG